MEKEKVHRDLYRSRSSPSLNRPYIIRRLCREGKIPAFSTAEGRFASGEKFGGQWRFDVREIEEWKEKQRLKRKANYV